MGWTMRGQIATVSGTHLVNSWAWDHEPDLPARAVIVAAEEGDSGSVVRITHGPFRPGEALPDEDQDHDSHLDGWMTFLPELKRMAERRD